MDSKEWNYMVSCYMETAEQVDDCPTQQSSKMPSTDIDLYFQIMESLFRTRIHHLCYRDNFGLPKVLNNNNLLICY